MASHGPGAAPGAGGDAGLYELLGVPPNASDEAIRSAVTEQRRTWRRRTTSPEIGVRQEAERRMQQLDEAERTLLDPARRQAYDAQARQPRQRPTTPPREEEKYLLRAVQQLEAGQYDVATFTARHAVEADPQNSYAWSVLAEASAGAEDNWGAKEAIERALSLEPENATLHATRGWILAKAGDHARSLSSYRTASRLAPGNAEFRARVVRALADQGRLDEAISEAEAAYQANPDDGDARTLLARALADRAVAAQHELPNGGLLISTASQASYVEALSNRGLSVQAPDPVVNDDLRRQRDYARKAQRRRFSAALLRRNYRWPVGFGLLTLAACCCAPNLLDAGLGGAGQVELLILVAGGLALLAFVGAVLMTCFEPQYKRNAALIEHTVPRRRGRGPGEPDRAR